MRIMDISVTLIWTKFKGNTMFENVLMFVAVVLLGVVSMLINGVIILAGWSLLHPATFPGFTFWGIVGAGAIAAAFGAHNTCKNK